MKMTKCDRCGKDIGQGWHTLTQTVFPVVTVSYVNGMPLMAHEVDLCSDCQKAVYDFIFGGGEKNEHDNSKS